MLCVIDKTIRMIMIELHMFSYCSACTIMSDVLYLIKESKQSFYSTKNPLIINFN